MTPAAESRAASLLTNVLNPFCIFTALYAAVSLAHGARPTLYIGAEIVAAGAVAGYVALARRRARVSDFWISSRAQRAVPALFLLGAFVALVLSLVLLDAPEEVVLTTLSMGLAAAVVAGITLRWKASAHCAVAGHAAVAGPLLLGPPGLAFALVLPLVLYARVLPRAHTVAQALVGSAIGAAFAALFLG